MIINYSKLSNQVRLLEVKDLQSPSVEIGLYLNIGSRYDSHRYSGLTHLIEHLNFQGTAIRPDNKSIVLEIENLGGNVDAFTSYEYMGFVIHAPTDKQFQIWSILQDMISNSKYQESEIEKEKKVIIEELKMYDDIPSEKVREEFQAILFSGNTLANNIVGNQKSLALINRDVITHFVKDAILPENMLISLTGSYSDELLKVINNNLAMYNNPATKLDYEKFVIKKNVSHHFIQRDVAQANIIIGSYGIARDANKRYALKIGQAMLSGGMGSILFQKIREELRLVYSIHSSHNAYADIGSFMIEMGLDEKNIKNAYHKVLNILEQFIQGKYSKSVFDRAKNYYKGMVITNIQSGIDIASWNAINLLLNKDILPESPKDIIAKIDKIEYNDIMSVWNEFLKIDALRLVQLTKNEVSI